MEMLSKLLKRAVDIIFFSHPQRTSLGILIGFVLYGFTLIFKPVLKDIPYFDLYAVGPLFYILLGIVMMRLRSAISLIGKNNIQNEDIEQALGLIKTVENQGLPKSHIRLLYLNLCNKVIDSVVLKEKTTKDLKKFDELREEAQKKIDPDVT